MAPRPLRGSVPPTRGGTGSARSGNAVAPTDWIWLHLPHGRSRAGPPPQALTRPGQPSPARWQDLLAHVCYLLAGCLSFTQPGSHSGISVGHADQLIHADVLEIVRERANRIRQFRWGCGVQACAADLPTLRSRTTSRLYVPPIAVHAARQVDAARPTKSTIDLSVLDLMPRHRLIPPRPSSSAVNIHARRNNADTTLVLAFLRRAGCDNAALKHAFGCSSPAVQFTLPAGRDRAGRTVRHGSNS